MMWISIEVILVNIICYILVEASKNVSRQEIISYLIAKSRYDANIVPDFNKEEATKVGIQITIHDMHSVSETTMDYSIDMFLRQWWRDERLDFTQNHTLFDKLELDPKNIENVWQPDTFFENEKRAMVHTVTTTNRLMHIHKNGTVVYSMRVAMTLSCTMLLHKYPFDSQRCPLILQSFGYTLDNIDLYWRSINPFTISNVEMPQFVLSNDDIKTTKTEINIQTGRFSSLRAEIYMQRKVGFYFLQVFVPCVLLVILSWVSFWVDAHAVPARVSLGVTCVLTMTTQSSGIRQSLPPVSYVKAIDIWMFVCLLFVFAALLEFAYVNVLQRGARKKPRKPKTITEEKDEIKEENGGNAVDTTDKKPDITISSAILRLCSRRGDFLDGNFKAKRVDVISRLIFPGSFTLFLILFAMSCAFLPDPTVEDVRVGT